MKQMNTFQQFIYYFQHNGSYILEQFIHHFLISIYGVILAAIVGIPLGIFIARRGKIKTFVMGIANVIQTIPSLAMISIIMLGLGLGIKTVVATVFLYSLLPIITNTYTGIRNALVVAIGITAIGAFVGGGGLGDIIIRGTNATNGGAIILAGSLPTALMAIFSDLILGGIQRMLEPRK